MSWWITYKTDKQLEEPHYEGGSYALNGTYDCSLNVTWNYNNFFDFSSLHGKKGKEVLPELKAFSEKYKDCKPSSNYWDSTPGNAKVAIDRLISFVELDLDAEFYVD